MTVQGSVLARLLDVVLIHVFLLAQHSQLSIPPLIQLSIHVVLADVFLQALLVPCLPKPGSVGRAQPIRQRSGTAQRTP